MHNEMSKETKDEILIRLRRRYGTAGVKHKGKLLDQAVELLGFHRKAEIRALRHPQLQKVVPRVSLALGRPRMYHPETLRPNLKPIWVSAFQPCGSRFACLGQRPKPVLFTRGRPYRKNDNARVEQRNWTHVRQHFAYERYDHPPVAPLIKLAVSGRAGPVAQSLLADPPVEGEAPERQSDGADLWTGLNPLRPGVGRRPK